MAQGNLYDKAISVIAKVVVAGENFKYKGQNYMLFDTKKDGSLSLIKLDKNYYESQGELWDYASQEEAEAIAESIQEA